MFWFILGSYTLILAVIWGFFIVIRIHALKFANFQTNIKKIVKTVFILLIILSILGYVAIFMMGDSFSSSVVRGLDESNIEDSLKNVDSNYY